MENPILAMIPSGYNAADAKLYSILPSDGSGDFTVSVDADATRVNKEGLIEGVALNQARLTYDPLNPECPSLLLEPTVTNIVYPNTSLSGYGINNGVKSDNVTISPDGEDNGSLVQSNGSGTCVIYKSFPTSLNTIYNISVFLKKGNYNNIRLQEGFTNSQMVVDLSNGTKISSGNTTNEKIEDYGNGWYRVSFNYTSHSSTSSAQYSVYIDGSTASGNTFYTFGGQIEQGSYPTSYVPTTNTQVTRTRDICKDAGNAALFNVSKLSLFIDVNNFKTNTGSFSYIVLTDGQNSPINMIRLDYTQNSISIRSYDNGTIKLSYNITSVVPNQRNKLLLTFDNNEAKTYFNGVLKNTSTSITIPSGLDSLSFTNRTESGGTFQGEVHDTRVYDRVLTETEAIKLTT